MKYRYFDISEFDCKETGENEMDPNFVKDLDTLRSRCEFPFVVTSGYRSPNHSIEKAKKKPGMHSTGRAVDIAVNNGAQRYKLVKEAMSMGFTGIGIYKSHVHLDQRNKNFVMWYG